MIKKVKELKNSIILIGVGLLNFLHASLHIIQFIQSLILLNEATHHHHHHSFIDSILHNPFFAIIWGIIGLITLWIGVKDFRHHEKCNH